MREHRALAIWSEVLFWSTLTILVVSILRLFSFFPINDDWAYHQTLQRWRDAHSLLYSNWVGTSFLWNAAWGRLFVIRGFSFLGLVVSTVTAGALAFVCFRLLVKSYAIPTHLALLGTACLCFNPYVITFLFSFMTDVHYMTWLLVATLFYEIGLSRNWLPGVAFATLASIAAFLVRQNGILIMVGALAAVAARRFFYNRRLSTIQCKFVLMILVAAFLAFLAFSLYYFKIQHPTDAFLFESEKLRTQLVSGEMLRKSRVAALKMLLFLGFGTLPLLPLSLNGLKRTKKNAFVLVGFLAVLMLGSMKANLLNFPGNEFPFESYWIGMIGPPPHALSDGVARTIGIASLVSASILMTILVQFLMYERLSFSSVVFWIAFLQAGFVISILPDAFSRYDLPILPFAILLSLYISVKERRPGPSLYGTSLLLVAGLCLFSVGMETLLLAQNDALWKTASRLLERRASVKEVEAGFAWDCWHLNDYFRKHPEEMVAYEGDTPWWIQNMTPVMTPKYVLTNSEYPPNYFGMDAVLDSEVPVRKPFLWSPGRLFLYHLERPQSGQLASEIDIAHLRHQDQLRTGWWGVERAADSHVRWTNGTSTAVLRMIPGDPYIRIRGYAVVRYLKRRELILNVSIDGEEAGQRSVHDEGTFELSFPVPLRARSKEQVIVSLTTSDTFRPLQDLRELGVIVTFVGLENHRGS